MNTYLAMPLLRSLVEAAGGLESVSQAHECMVRPMPVAVVMGWVRVRSLQHGYRTDHVYIVIPLGSASHCCR